MLSLLLLSHNHNAQGYSFSWLVDSCVASCKEYAAQFNDLDVWKKTVCVLVGIAAFDKCISITKGTWNFLFRKSSRSSEPVSQEVTAMRVDIRQINERLASWQARNQDEEENSEDRMAESRQMKQIYSVLKKINLSLDEMQKEHIEIKKDTAVCQRLAISAAVKSQQVNTKLKQIGKISQPYKRASVPVRPSIVPRIWLPDETEAASPIRNKRARINAGIKIPGQATLQRLHERTTTRPTRHNSDSTETSEEDSSSSSSDMESLTASTRTSATTPDDSSARTSATNTPHSLDNKRGFEGGKRAFDVSEEKDRQDLFDDNGTRETPRNASRLPSPLRKYSTKKKSKPSIPSWSAPGSLIRTPKTTRLNKSNSCQELLDLKKGKAAKAAKDSGEFSDDYFVTEDGDAIDISSGEEKKPLTPLSAKQFVDVVPEATSTKTPEELAEERFYYETASKKVEKRCDIA